MSKRLLQSIPLILIPVLFIGIVRPNAACADDSWYNANWLFRKQITINSDNISGSINLANFPILVNITDDDLRDDAQNDGDDILFTADNGLTRLSHEIENFNEITGNLIAWVMIPDLPATVDTDIYIYYGNPAASNQQDSDNVWDSYYKMVQHMEENSGDPDPVTDSTPNNNDGTDNGAITFQSAGKIYNSISIDGTDASDDYINIAHHSSIDFDAGDSFTIETWVNITDKGQTGTQNYQYFVDKRASGWGKGYQLYTQENNYARFLIADGSNSAYLTDDMSLADGDWHYVVGVRDTTQDTLRLYLDGTEATANVTDTTTANLLNDENLNIGRVKSDPINRELNGSIDEVRISSKARDEHWIKTSYNNQTNPDNFITLGFEEVREAPKVIGGLVLPVNKATIIAPWFCLGIILSLIIAGIILYVKERLSSNHHR